MWYLQGIITFESPENMWYCFYIRKIGKVLIFSINHHLASGWYYKNISRQLNKPPIYPSPSTILLSMLIELYFRAYLLKMSFIKISWHLIPHCGIEKTVLFYSKLEYLFHSLIHLPSWSYFSRWYWIWFNPNYNKIFVKGDLSCLKKKPTSDLT